MNRKTILSSHFPEFVEKWKKFQNNFKRNASWYITSDYCLDDKNKPNDVMTFTIFPFIHPYILKEGIKHNLSKDIKDFSNLSEKAINYIKESPYSFSISFIIEGKNNIFNLEQNKQLMDKLIKGMDNWPQNKKEEFIHKIKSFKNYLYRKEIDIKTLSNISVLVHIMSSIIEFLLIKANARHIYWISDRDNITSFHDGIVHEFIRLGYANLINRRVSDNEVYGYLEAKDYDKKIFDDFIRIPDYISGSIASMNFSDVNKIPDKHYKLFAKSIIDNERIYIMKIEHQQNEDILSDLKFTRV